MSELLSLGDLLADMKTAVRTLYQHVDDDTAHFHPHSQTGTRYHGINNTFLENHKTLVRILDIFYTSTIGHSDAGMLRKYLRFVKDRGDSSKKLSQLKDCLAEVRDRTNKYLKVHGSGIQNNQTVKQLESMCKWLTKHVEKVEFSLDGDDEHPDTSVISIGSLGKESCFAIIINLIKDRVSTVSVIYMIGEDDWQLDEANRDLMECLKDHQYDRLRHKLIHMLETERVQAECKESASVDIIRIRDYMTKYLKQALGNYSLTQCLEGPSIVIDSPPVSAFVKRYPEEFQTRITFEGLKNNGKLLYVFDVSPPIPITMTAAAELPSEFSPAMKQDSVSLFAQSLPEMKEGIPFINLICDSTNTTKFEVEGLTTNYTLVPTSQCEQRGIIVSCFLLPGDCVFDQLPILVKRLRQQACINYLIASCFRNDLEASGELNQAFEVSITDAATIEVLTQKVEGDKLVLMKATITVDLDSGIPVVSLEGSHAHHEQYANKLLSACRSIPLMMTFLVLQSQQQPHVRRRRRSRRIN